MIDKLICWCKQLSGASLLLLLAPLAFADITGTVFRDLNANGVRETGATYLEPGVGDITVSCVDSTGNTGSATTSNAPATLASIA
ncbi:MAG: hypothetical protein HZT40_08795 [Candidatus Thiothrix singaporensis]|uniref:SD-repeat containing protein B domain-containing protein n=1 Tax=Candidatus Thiothrix singaporensis TaxID=2799669 RepID=A0A7L6ARR9_9GAMM|nr:MAG: hypothetical protein HZT40_08795 [Candidatus Thiothrix singaporensis]